jgi:hypothetical protein
MLVVANRAGLRHDIGSARAFDQRAGIRCILPASAHVKHYESRRAQH